MDDQEYPVVIAVMLIPNPGVNGQLTMLPAAVRSDGAIFQLAGIGSLVPVHGLPGQMRALSAAEWLPLPPVPGTEAAAKFNEEAPQ